MVYDFRGCASMKEWFERFPDDALLLFRAASGNAAIIERRQRAQCKRIEILGIGDPAMSVAERARVAYRFATKLRAEVGDGIPGDIWDEHWLEAAGLAPENKVAAIVESLCSKATLYGHATMCMRFSVAPCKTEHATNRQAAVQKDQIASFARLAATSVDRQLGETGLGATAYRQREMGALVHTELPYAIAPLARARSQLWSHQTLEEREVTWERGLRATDLHRIDWIAELRAQDASIDCCTPESWAQ